MPLTGTVIEEQKNYFVVDTGRGQVKATTKGVLKKDRTRVCTGDKVTIELLNEDSMNGIITAITPRKTFLKRPPLANITQVVLIGTFKEPQLDLAAMDRFLVNGMIHDFRPVIVFNKVDLLLDTERAAFDEIVASYRRTGFPVLTVSAETGENIGALIEACAGTTSAFAGLSGVGKSRLLSLIFPDREFRIGDVSGSTGRGTHTTTSVSLVPLPQGGYIADTPGFSFVEIPLIPEEEVVNCFPELESRLGQCKFNNCIHENEPGCIIRELVKSGEIPEWRLDHYLNIFNEMRERRRGYKER